MTAADRKLRVFLCHASHDKPFVRELYQRLLTEGWIDPWLDEEKLLPGQDWDLEIEKAVDASDAVIAFLSGNSVTKEGYVQKELRKVLNAADEKPEGTIFVVPFRMEDCQIPKRLKSWQYLDYFPNDQRIQAYQRLLSSLRLRFDEIMSKTSGAHSTNLLMEWDEKWLGIHRLNAQNGLKRNGFVGFVEVQFTVHNQNLKVHHKDLLSVARHAQIHTFGWPIGVVLDSANDGPRPLADGIVSEIEFKNMQWAGGLLNSYDYWTIRNNGDFYLLKSLFEDDGVRWTRGTVIAFDTRIHRTTEILLYCQRLYDKLGVDPSAIVKVCIRHSGLKDRQLTSTTGRLLPRRATVCIEFEIEKTIQIPLSEIRSNLVNMVREFTQPLFLLFDFQEFADSIYEDIVNNYAEGKIV